MKKNIRISGLLLIMFILSLGAWNSLHNSIVSPGAQDWIIPGVFFSIVFAFWIIGAILLKGLGYRALLFSLSLFPSLFFVFSWGHFLILAISVLLLLWSSARIKREMQTAVKINLWRSVRFGRILVVLALALAVSSHYYSEIQKDKSYRKIPQLNLSSGNEKIIAKITSIFYPGVDISKDQGMTIDELILQSQQENENKSESREDIEKMINEQLGEEISEQQKEELISSYLSQKQLTLENNNEFILIEGRKQVSELAGVQVRGDEKVADVFSKMINRKIEDFLNFDASSGNGQGGATYLPAVLVALLFLSILSLGSFFAPFLVSLAQLIFWVMRRLKWVEIRKVTVEQEVID